MNSDRKFSSMILLLFLLLASTGMEAQDYPMPGNHPGAEKTSSFWDHFFTGGNFGLQFGTETLIDIAPIFGYRVTDRFSVGLGAQYMYYKFKDYQYNYSTNIYGGSVFTRYLVTDNLFTHMEVEVLNLDVRAIYGGFVRKNITSVLVGGGYRQMLGERSSLNLMLLYNLNQTSDSPYLNPIVRVGFGIGI